MGSGVSFALSSPECKVPAWNAVQMIPHFSYRNTVRAPPESQGTPQGLHCPHSLPVPSPPIAGLFPPKSVAQPALVLLYTIIALWKYFLGEPNGFLCRRAWLVPLCGSRRGPGVAAANGRGWLEPRGLAGRAQPAPPYCTARPHRALLNVPFFPSANQNKQKCP